MKQRVLFFHPVNDCSGSTTALVNLLEHDYCDQEITVVTDGVDGLLSKLSNVKIECVHYPTLRKKKFFIISYLCKLISFFFSAINCRKSYDQYYLNTIMVYPVAFASWFINKKIVWHIHEKFIFASNSYIKLEYDLAETIFEKTICERVFVSKYVFNKYKRNDKCLEQIKPNYLSRSFIEKITMKPITERKRQNVIMLASLTKAKGLFTFLEVAKILPCFNFSLIISADMCDIVSFFNVDMPENVLLYSKQSNINSFLEYNDVMLNLSIPSWGIETFGMTIIEAMAYGIPSIVPNVGGPAEIVLHGINGYCIDVTDPIIVSETIEKTLAKENYYKLAENALNRSKLYV